MMNTCRKVIVHILMVSIVGLTSVAGAQDASFTRIAAQPLPEGPALLTLNNDVVNLPAGPLFINIWASWCKPCVDELPALNDLKARYEDNDIQWVALNYGDSLAQVNRFLDTIPIDLTVLLDATAQYSRQLPMKGLPVTFLVDRDGQMLYQMDGYADWTDPGLIREWEALMPELITPP